MSRRRHGTTTASVLLLLGDCDALPAPPHPTPLHIHPPAAAPLRSPVRSCEIGDGVRLSNCVILNRVTIKNYALVADSIIGWSSKREAGRRGWGGRRGGVREW